MYMLEISSTRYWKSPAICAHGCIQTDAYSEWSRSGWRWLMTSNPCTPWKFNIALKIYLPTRTLLTQKWLFRGYVKLGGCTLYHGINHHPTKNLGLPMCCLKSFVQLGPFELPIPQRPFGQSITTCSHRLVTLNGGEKYVNPSKHILNSGLGILPSLKLT